MFAAQVCRFDSGSQRVCNIPLTAIFHENKRAVERLLSRQELQHLSWVSQRRLFTVRQFTHDAMEERLILHDSHPLTDSDDSIDRRTPIASLTEKIAPIHTPAQQQP
mmetsp:Transcript_42868/g.82072  ORF Transcript_42868/g.82072 Transcript_42868/m.82072 type:complete len:107 (-) Transcript_42868:11-331(-)